MPTGRAGGRPQGCPHPWCNAPGAIWAGAAGLEPHGRYGEVVSRRRPPTCPVCGGTLVGISIAPAPSSASREELRARCPVHGRSPYNDPAWDLYQPPSSEVQAALRFRQWMGLVTLTLVAVLIASQVLPRWASGLAAPLLLGVGVVAASRLDRARRARWAGPDDTTPQMQPELARIATAHPVATTVTVASVSGVWVLAVLRDWRVAGVYWVVAVVLVGLLWGPRGTLRLRALRTFDRDGVRRDARPS